MHTHLLVVSKVACLVCVNEREVPSYTLSSQSSYTFTGRSNLDMYLQRIPVLK